VDIRAIEQQVRMLCAAQALLQVLNTVPAGLVLRDIYPQYDLLTGAGAAITSEDWRQPANSGNWSKTSGSIDDPESVYKSGLTSKYNLKVMLYYGFELVGVGNFRSSKTICCNSVIFKRGNVKLIDIIDVQSLDTRDPPILIQRTPVMYKAADDLHIQIAPDSAHLADANKFDTIKFIGVTCEPLGQSQTG